jgi:hypothetical protein
MADWFLIKESNGLEFFEPFENRAKAIESAAKWDAEVIRQATIVETEALDNGDAEWIKENN